MNSTNWPAPNVWVFIAQLPKAEAIGSNPVEVSKFFFRVNLKLFKLQLPLHATIILSFKVCWILSWQNWKKVYGPLRKPFQLLNVSLSVHYSLLYKLKVLWSMLRWLESLIECLQWRWNTNLFIVEFLVPVQTMQLLNTHWVWYDKLFISIWELTKALRLASTLWWVSFSPLERNEGLIGLFSHSFIKWMSEWMNEQTKFLLSWGFDF